MTSMAVIRRARADRQDQHDPQPARGREHDAHGAVHQGQPGQAGPRGGRERARETASTPCSSTGWPDGVAAPSAASVTPGSSSATRAAKSPPREAARNAAVTSRWRARLAARSGLGAPRIRRRARLASCRAASGAPQHRRHLGELAWRTCRAARTRAARRGSACRARPAGPGRPSPRAPPRPPGHPPPGPGRRLAAAGHCPPTGSSSTAGPEHVERHPGDDRGQPAAQVPHLAGVGAGQPQPGVLDRVVGVARRAEQPVRHRPQVTAVLLEGGGQPVCSVIPSRSLTARSYHPDTGHPADVTARGRQRRRCSSARSQRRLTSGTSAEIPAGASRWRAGVRLLAACRPKDMSWSRECFLIAVNRRVRRTWYDISAHCDHSRETPHRSPTTAI